MPAAAAACSLGAEAERLTAIIKPQGAFTFALPDGRSVVLQGLGAPLGAARKTLTETLQTGMSEPAEIEVLPRPDRFSRLPVLIRYQGHDLREALLTEGLAYRLPMASEPCNDRMQAAETAARDAKKGLWAGHWPLKADEKAHLAGSRNQFAIIEGSVFSAQSSRGIIYINLGPRGSGALSLSLLAKDRPSYSAKGRDPLALTGRRVLVRGTVEFARGYRIRLESPDMLDILP